jgi:hypothetical protein
VESQDVVMTFVTFGNDPSTPFRPKPSDDDAIVRGQVQEGVTCRLAPA